MSKFQFRIGQTEEGKPVKIDLDTFIHTRAAFIANSGGGKTTALYTLIEQSADRVQWIIIDPEGEYANLRELFPNMLLVGKEGEVPVDLKSAKLLARKIVEMRVSAIIDLYGLTKLRAEYAAQFIDTLINLPRDLWTPMIVAIDEGHRLAPETPTGNKAEREQLMQSRRAIITLADSGRKQHRGAIVASQRVSKMAADARAELRNRLVGLCVQDLDRDRAADDLGFSKSQSRELRDLKAGQFYVYGPAFVGITGIAKIQIDLPKTKPPQAGSKIATVPPASDALKQLIATMGDLPKQADAETNTVAAAQRRIVELENQLRARPVQIQPKVEQVVKTIEMPIFKEGDLATLERLINALSQAGADSVNLGNQVIVAARDLGQTMQAATRRTPQPIAPAMPRASAPQSRAVPTRAPRAMVASETNGGELRGGERLILIATAQYPNGVTREQLTVLSGYKRTSRDTYLQRLSARGFIAVERDRIVAMPAGIDALGNDFQPLPTGQALVEYWMNRLTGGEKAIFEIVVLQCPNGVARDELDERTGYKRTSRNTFIQHLRARELVTERGGVIRASDHLFE